MYFGTRVNTVNNHCIMEAGLGIGGLAVGKDEVASSAFDLFSPIEIEHSIEKSSKLTVTHS